MAKYRNTKTGALVSVRDDKVLGSEWEAVKAAPAPAKPTGSKRGSAATSGK